LELKLNKKLIVYVISIILLLSALIYNVLYINNKKNEIEMEEEAIEEEEIIVEEKTIFIDVGGEVVNPGLYELPENSRVNDAINIAGGTTDKADLTEVNLAYILSDAIKITIPKKEIKKVTTAKVTTPKTSIVSTGLSTIQGENNKETGKVNINTGSKEQLKTLDGIGDATAQKIIDYRNEKGNFGKIEDIKNVSGIGESKFNKIKEKIII